MYSNLEKMIGKSLFKIFYFRELYKKYMKERKFKQERYVAGRGLRLSDGVDRVRHLVVFLIRSAASMACFRLCLQFHEPRGPPHQVRVHDAHDVHDVHDVHGAHVIHVIHVMRVMHVMLFSRFPYPDQFYRLQGQVRLPSPDSLVAAFHRLLGSHR